MSSKSWLPRLILVVCLVSAGSWLAFHGASADAQRKEGKPTVYDFEDDVVEGELLRPDATFIGERRKVKHSSLIEIREDFVPEMLKSAEDI